MFNNWAATKDELYGPPPAYSNRNEYENRQIEEETVIEPPSYLSSVYVLPAQSANNRQCHDRSTTHPLIFLPKRFSCFLTSVGLFHLLTGIGSIVCDIILTVMNESYSFAGLWTGSCSIIFGIYIFVFLNSSEKHICALERLRFFNLVIIMAVIAALVLSSINLASDWCYKLIMGPDRCHDLSYALKIILIIIFSSNLLTLCITFSWILRDGKKMRSHDYRSSGTID